MVLDRFLGRRPSHFELNPVVKAFIISESFLWSAWDFVLPIIAIFIAKDIPGGSIQTAAMGFSIYLISRIIFELCCGKFLQHSRDKKKMLTAIVGIFLLSIAYFGFAYTYNLQLLFFFYAVLGAGFGIATPAKNTLFSIHLDKNKEASEWSLNDAICALAMALATALGGFIAAEYGFHLLFLIAGTVNLLSVLPYALYVYPNLDLLK
jgi:MFS family permease